MRYQAILGGITAVALGASMVAAQQPQREPQRAPAPGGRPSMMTMMDSLNHRLDSLVARMNRTTGNQKIQAMADVINELVAQRKLMQEHMHRMMEGGGMMRMGDSTLKAGPKPSATRDSGTTDTTDHAAHHPPS